MSELAEFLEGEEPTVETPTEPEAVTETPAEPEPEAPKEPEATAEEPQGSTTEPDEPEKADLVPVKALLDERGKRQSAERELEILRAQSVETPPAPDVLDDQEGFVNHVKSQVDQGVRQGIVAMSRDLMMAQHDDFLNKEEQFMKMAEENPSLINQMWAVGNPAKFAYDTVIKAERLAAMENVDEWEAKKEAEIEARVIARMEAKAAEKAKQDAKGDALSPSLTAQRAEGANAPVMDVPNPLQSTFNR